MHASHSNSRFSAFGWLRLALAGLALSLLAACTEDLDTKVTRFTSQLPRPTGQSFTIIADDPHLAGGIEFGQYASLVAKQLTEVGYTPAASPDTAALIVRLDYGVDSGRQVADTNDFWGPWRGYVGWGGRYPRGGWGASWGWGWQSPWFDNSYTLYTSGITLKIDDRSGKRLFEGNAEAASTSNRLPYLVPNLIEAMFTNFPGDSGKTERITIAPEKPDAAKAGSGK